VRIRLGAGGPRVLTKARACPGLPGRGARKCAIIARTSARAHRPCHSSARAAQQARSVIRPACRSSHTGSKLLRGGQRPRRWVACTPACPAGARRARRESAAPAAESSTGRAEPSSARFLDGRPGEQDDVAGQRHSAHQVGRSGLAHHPRPGHAPATRSTAGRTSACRGMGGVRRTSRPVAAADVGREGRWHRPVVGRAAASDVRHRPGLSRASAASRWSASNCSRIGLYFIEPLLITGR
jgi:hypothetical protein